MALRPVAARTRGDELVDDLRGRADRALLEHVPGDRVGDFLEWSQSAVHVAVAYGLFRACVMKGEFAAASWHEIIHMISVRDGAVPALLCAARARTRLRRDGYLASILDCIFGCRLGWADGFRAQRDLMRGQIAPPLAGRAVALKVCMEVLRLVTTTGAVVVVIASMIIETELIGRNHRDIIVYDIALCPCRCDCDKVQPVPLAAGCIAINMPTSVPMAVAVASVAMAAITPIA